MFQCPRQRSMTTPTSRSLLPTPYSLLPLTPTVFLATRSTPSFSTVLSRAARSSCFCSRESRRSRPRASRTTAASTSVVTQGPRHTVIGRAKIAQVPRSARNPSEQLVTRTSTSAVKLAAAVASTAAVQAHPRHQQEVQRHVDGQPGGQRDPCQPGPLGAPEIFLHDHRQAEPGAVDQGPGEHAQAAGVLAAEGHLEQPRGRPEHHRRPGGQCHGPDLEDQVQSLGDAIAPPGLPIVAQVRGDHGGDHHGHRGQEQRHHP